MNCGVCKIGWTGAVCRIGSLATKAAWLWRQQCIRSAGCRAPQRLHAAGCTSPWRRLP